MLSFVMMESIVDSIRNIKRRIAYVCKKSGRNPDDIILVAAAKYVSAKEIEEVIQNGINCIGENRVQDAWCKFSQVKLPAEWHMIGHLQTNKAKKAAEIFSWIHSVDSIKLAEQLNRNLEGTVKKINVLLEVNISGEESKYGVKREDAEGIAKEILGLSQVELKGLMTMAPLSDNSEDSRPYFRGLRILKEEIENKISKNLGYLSMGMTDDFEVAIEEGANIVRIGRGIFIQC